MKEKRRENKGETEGEGKRNERKNRENKGCEGVRRE